MRLIFLLAPFLILSTSCDQSDDIGTGMTCGLAKEYPAVAKEFWPYFQSFEVESARRSADIDLVESGITVSYAVDGLSTGPLPGAETVGTCRHNVDKPNAIFIDSAYWSKAFPLRQEEIIFHELGHCILNRLHDNAINSDGTCKSLMRSGPGSCFLVYNSRTRKAYLDELFK